MADAASSFDGAGGPSPDVPAFHALFSSLAKIGATEAGGVHRLAADEEDGRARDALRDWLGTNGFEMRIDAVGNMFGLATLSPGAPFVLLGSHLDSQPFGGRFDGAYGVVAACIAVKSVADWCASSGTLPAWNLAIVNWTNEEGARFQPSLMGSSVFSKLTTAERALGSRDDKGISLKEALAAIGYAGTDEAPTPIACALEIHVEQGRELELSGERIGVVTGSWAALKCLVRFHGEPAHTGPTRMKDRRDALLAAARAIVMVRELADVHPQTLHSSVGKIDVAPNSPNVVASRVDVRVELRAAEAGFLSALSPDFEARLQAIATETGTIAEIVSRDLRPERTLAPALMRSAKAVAGSLGLKVREMKTVSGHDVLALAEMCDSALVFVPSAGGISHSEKEFTADDEMEDGLILMTELAWRLCREGSTVLGLTKMPAAGTDLAFHHRETTDTEQAGLFGADARGKEHEDGR